jgi:hypothetical protein
MRAAQFGSFGVTAGVVAHIDIARIERRSRILTLRSDVAHLASVAAVVVAVALVAAAAWSPGDLGSVTAAAAATAGVLAVMVLLLQGAERRVGRPRTKDGRAALAGLNIDTLTLEDLANLRVRSDPVAGGSGAGHPWPYAREDAAYSPQVRAAARVALRTWLRGHGVTDDDIDTAAALAATWDGAVTDLLETVRNL